MERRAIENLVDRKYESSLRVLNFKTPPLDMPRNFTKVFFKVCEVH